MSVRSQEVYWIYWKIGIAFRVRVYGLHFRRRMSSFLI